MGRFHNYSFGNILEIARQRPSATRVAGMYAWNQLGRRINKGEKGTLDPVAGACVTCPRCSGHNTSLFCDVQGDQCLDSPCYHSKVEAFLDREMAAKPDLVQIENSWRNPKEQRPGTALLFLNLSASLISAGWAMAALVRPTSLSKSGNPSNGEKFYARMYAARSIPFGLLTAVMPFWAGERAVPWLLFAAAAIQVADVVIGMEIKARQMMIGASIAAIIHILCGLAML